jgi:hypothetical protein
MASRRISLAVTIMALALAPALMGARGCGGAYNSMTPAPKLTGTWNVAYDDMLGIEVTLGGATYTSELGANGGTFTIDHMGQPITFDLACDRPEIVCPSEAWPATVDISQEDMAYPHRAYVDIPKQYCMGTEVAPDPAECGEGTLNPDCERVCDGEVGVMSQRTYGVVNEAGTEFSVLLGAGVATNGVNCALLGISVAHADLVTMGSSETEDWEGTAMESGEIIVAYAGGCLWAGDVDDDGTIEALVLGASLKFTTGFTAMKR